MHFFGKVVSVDTPWSYVAPSPVPSNTLKQAEHLEILMAHYLLNLFLCHEFTSYSIKMTDTETDGGKYKDEANNSK